MPISSCCVTSIRLTHGSVAVYLELDWLIRYNSSFWSHLSGTETTTHKKSRPVGGFFYVRNPWKRLFNVDLNTRTHIASVACVYAISKLHT